MKIHIFWFRRDLRLNDNVGLFNALKDAKKNNVQVIPLFIFDTHILNDLQNKTDARMQFIYNTLLEMQKELEALQSNLLVCYGTPEEVWEQLIKKYDIHSVFCNNDYEPYSIQRDKNIQNILKKENIHFYSSKDHVIFEKNEIVKKDGSPYVVFTPYSRLWKSQLYENSQAVKFYNCTQYYSYFYKSKPDPIISLQDMGFETSNISLPTKDVCPTIIQKYDQTRNFPKFQTSNLGIHFRFGTISIREKVQQAMELNEIFLDELIWRDFYHKILFFFPHVVKYSFKKKYDAIIWQNNEKEFKLWCEGKTGYPIVDAGMRELKESGHMHNRVRMITASFLIKHLLIDWRWGEKHFATHLLDFDLASNNGGWQWVAGCGTDAAPYFRIFNPISQQQKFDADFQYIKKWLPEFDTPQYCEPIIEHSFARQRCLEVYKDCLANADDGIY